VVAVVAHSVVGLGPVSLGWVDLVAAGGCKKAEGDFVLELPD